MLYKFNGVDVFYRFEGEGSQKPVLFLHGWGCDSHIFDNFLTLFHNKKFLLLDFPPFGKSKTEPKDWNIFTYANMVISLCEQLGLNSIDVVGHSFGGRVAILLCALRPDLFSKCVLIDSAGIKPHRGLKYFSKVYSYKLARWLGFRFVGVGSPDYQALSSDMKKVFVAIVNEHLDDYLPLIKQKTLIIFGAKDKDTPVYMAKRLHKCIKNSRLEILQDAGHFSFLDRALSCYRLIDEFLEEI